MKRKLGSDALAIVLLSALLSACSGMPYGVSEYEANARLRQQIIGQWVQEGERWEFGSNGQGFFSSYGGHSSFPVNRAFRWKLSKLDIVIELPEQAPWPKATKRYRIKELTTDKLTLSGSSQSAYLQRSAKADSQ